MSHTPPPVDFDLWELLPVPLYCKDNQGRFIRCNPAFEKVSGLRQSDIVGKAVHEVFHSQYADMFYAKDMELLQSPGVQEYEGEVEDASGVSHQVLFHKVTWQNADGQLQGILGFMVDVTALHQAKQQANTARMLLDTILDNIPHYICLKEAVSKRYLHVNKSMLALLGKTADEMIGHYPEDVFEPAAASKMREMEDAILASGAIQVQELALPHQHLEALLFRITYVPIPCGTDCQYLLSIAEDLSEQRLQEQRIREASHQNQELLAAISSILVGVNEQDEVTHWNLEAVRYFQAPAKSRLGKNFFELPFSWNWARIHPAVAFCRQYQKAVMLRDLRYTRFDGKEGFLQAKLSPFPGSTGKGRGFLLLAEEATRQKVLESQVMQAQKLESVELLASGIAHEINTPAQYIGDNMRYLQQSYASVLELLRRYEELRRQMQAGKVDSQLLAQIETLREDNDVEYLLQDIPKALHESLEGISRISGIVKSMKEFSHPGVAEKTTISLRSAIESTLTVSRNEWKYLAEVTTKFDKSMPPILIYPGEFNQVVLNIVINAVHALEQAGYTSRNKGEIHIETEWVDGWAVVRIRDNGPGVPQAIRNRIFEPFFTTKPIGRGTGQGLALAHSIIVERHGGRLRLETGQNHGATFIIELPSENARDEYSF